MKHQYNEFLQKKLSRHLIQGVIPLRLQLDCISEAATNDEISRVVALEYYTIALS